MGLGVAGLGRAAQPRHAGLRIARRHPHREIKMSEAELGGRDALLGRRRYHSAAFAASRATPVPCKRNAAILTWAAATPCSAAF